MSDEMRVHFLVPFAALLVIASCKDEGKEKEIRALKAQLAAAKQQQQKPAATPAPTAAPDETPKWDAMADEEEKSRAPRIKKHFPEVSNALDDCVAKKGGAHARKENFGSAEALAYEIQLGGSHAASRFMDYFHKVWSCTPFGSHAEKQFIALLPYIQNVKQLGVAIAVVGDVMAAQAQTSEEAVQATVRVIVTNFERTGTYDGKRRR